MSRSAPGDLDPVVTTKVKISAEDKVATMGSCFAQHISQHLLKQGLGYFITEPGPPEMSDVERRERNFGVFSARYGNVYTVRQAIQLFDRAFGTFRPTVDVWDSPGGFVDPFRPQIEPRPWSNPIEVRVSSDEHLQAVRQLFLESDVLIFTLGLTEAFMSIEDGSVFPVAPGVSGGSFDPAKHKFVNFSAQEVSGDLEEFVNRLRHVNPRIRLILTVSPVPLIATYEPRHVLVSTTLSKAILRVAAHEVSSRHDFIDYFPSFEIISGSAIGARYFDTDLRQVRKVGVNHVMRVFERHVLRSEADPGRSRVPSLPDGLVKSSLVCDEEMIMNAINDPTGQRAPE